MDTKKRMVVGISGASGATIALHLLESMSQLEDWETHLVVSRGALRTIEHETDLRAEALQCLATEMHPLEDVGASIASGTFHTEGMVVVPCSMKTLAGIASGYSDNLLLRAADVALKERRKLVLVARETPLSTIHLENMLRLANKGVIVMPPMLTFYQKPDTLEDLVVHIVGKIMAEFGLRTENFRPWHNG